jgi:hypothetical protein
MARVAAARGPTTTPWQPCQAALYKFAATTTAPALAPLGWAQGRATTLIMSRGCFHAAEVDRPPRGHGAAGAGAWQQKRLLSCLGNASSARSSSNWSVLCRPRSPDDNSATPTTGGTWRQPAQAGVFAMDGGD